MVDDHGMIKPGTRVEALKSGTQGTWYIARIVELASFPAHYIDSEEAADISQEWYPMACVHYEGRLSVQWPDLIGFPALQSAWIPQSSLRLISSQEDMSPLEWINYKKLWRYGPRGLEDHWIDYTE